ncbi:tetratricopeptide repeat-containing sensor histidine kinase [Flavobacterium sp. SM2513]|uniref:tetratricopeptide repeat-containing sensor histidine kinase n=1 Tax=Flavobacterium sp. SM2513 TaxID=3424766 RepID=UPI003D7FC6FD
MKYFCFFTLLLFQFSFAQNDSIVKLGKQLTYENKHSEAIAYFNKHLAQPKNSVQEIELLLALADVYKLELKFNKANDHYLRAYKRILEIKNEQLEFLYYVKRAEFYRKRTLYQEMVKQLDKAGNILKKHPINDAYLAKYYSRKAALFTEYYNIADSTLVFAKKSLLYATKINDKDNIFYSRLEIACVYEREMDLKRAIDEFESLIAYAKENRLVQNQADVTINYINVLIKDNQIDKALSEALAAMAFAKKYNLLYNENIFTIKVYELYKGLKKFEKANEYLEYRHELSERYYELEHNQFLFELEEKYKVDEKENQITIKNLELVNKSKELSTNKVRFYIFLGLFLAALVIALLIAYFLNKTRDTNKELQFLSQQNEFLLSEANHRINNNLQLIIILIEVQLSKISESEGQEIQKILKKINSIATLHRHLYQSNDKRHVNSYKYLKDIQVSFSDLFLENGIKTKFTIESIELSADVSMYLGLLLTELCINSIKHAFEQQDQKEIRFQLTKDTEFFYFYYSDSGVGLPQDSIQPKLIEQMCRQLRIKYTITNEDGFCFSFKKEHI